MINDINSLLPLLKTIIAAIEKAVGSDLRNYLKESSNKTNNAILQLRGDFINTNLSVMLDPEITKLKLFKRFAWMGCLLIDEEHKITLSITTKQNLIRIQGKEKIGRPHYLWSICHVENRNLEVIPRYPLFPEYEDDITYERDYLSIVDDDRYISEDYHHYVLAYSSVDFQVTDAVLFLLNRNLDEVQEFKLGHLIKPDFADLTVFESSAENNNEGVIDSHNLISLKADLPRSFSVEPEKNPDIEVHHEELAHKTNKRTK